MIITLARPPEEALIPEQKLALQLACIDDLAPNWLECPSINNINEEKQYNGLDNYCNDMHIDFFCTKIKDCES